MSCENCKHEEDTSSAKDIIDRIEFAVGYAININMTNFYKRDLMKDIIDKYDTKIYHLMKNWNSTDIEYKESIKAGVKKDILDSMLKDIEKIANAEDGYTAIKEYANIIVDLHLKDYK